MRRWSTGAEPHRPVAGEREGRLVEERVLARRAGGVVEADVTGHAAAGCQLPGAEQGGGAARGGARPRERSGVSGPPGGVPGATPAGSCSFQSTPPLTDTAASPWLTMVTVLHTTAGEPIARPSYNGVVLISTLSRVMVCHAAARVSLWLGFRSW